MSGNFAERTFGIKAKHGAGEAASRIHFAERTFGIKAKPMTFPPPQVPAILPKEHLESRQSDILVSGGGEPILPKEHLESRQSYSAYRSW